ncbi:hypothetical protein V6N12_051330 [Hibiscus sabdariffa]|uniref:Uncharacterized protein n=1 Tax=Hibiscus sabdariffa TaxID=183260 RepID=A0ABR2GEZ9_9ROSI
MTASGILPFVIDAMDFRSITQDFKELEKKLEDKIEKSFTEKFQDIRLEVIGIRQEVMEMKALPEAVLGQSSNSKGILYMSPTDMVTFELAERVEWDSTTTTLTEATTPKLDLKMNNMCAAMMFVEMSMITNKEVASQMILVPKEANVCMIKQPSFVPVIDEKLYKNGRES